MNTKATLSILFLYLLVGASLAAAAESAVDSEIDALLTDVRLDETVVTPTRGVETLFTTPYATTVVPPTELSGARAPRSIARALEAIPGVMVQKTGYGQASPYIRGLTGFRNLMLIDGIRLNNSVFRDGPNQYLATVNNLSLRSLELVRGPGSVLYGSDAMGGTLNLLPLQPIAGPDGYGWGAEILTRFASAERSAIGRLTVQGGSGHEFGFILGADRKQFGDLDAGSGRLPETGYDEANFDGRAIWSVTDDLDLTFAFQHNTQWNVPRTHKTIYSVPFHGTTVGSELRRDLDQSRTLLFVRADVADPFSFAESLGVTLSWHQQEEDRDRVKSSGKSDRSGFSVNTIGLLAQMVSETGIGTLTYGLDAYRDFVDSYSRKYDTAGNLTSVGIQGPVADNSTYDLLGIFIQDQVDLGSGLVLTAGLRGTYAAVDAKNVADPMTGEKVSLDDSWTAAVGNIRLAWFATENLNLYGGVSQGFRAPNLSDLTRLDSARSNEIETPSPNLDPERVVTFEIGAKGRTGDLSGQISLYHTLLSDLIMRHPTGREVDGEMEVTKSNVGDGFAQGIELTADWNMTAEFRLFGGGGYINGKADTFPTSAPIKRREYLDRLPPLQGYLGLEYVNVSGLILGAEVRAADKADRLSTRDKSDTQRIPPGGTPGWAAVNFWATYPVCEGFLLSVGVDNIANKDYRIHGSGQNEPGRNFWLTAIISF